MSLRDQARRVTEERPEWWSFTGFNPETRDELAKDRQAEETSGYRLSTVGGFRIQRDGAIRDVTMMFRESESLDWQYGAMRIPNEVSDRRLELILAALETGGHVRISGSPENSPTERTLLDGTPFREMQIDSLVLLEPGMGGRSRWLVGREIAAPLHDRPIDRTAEPGRDGIGARMVDRIRSLTSGPKEVPPVPVLSRGAER